MSLFWLCSALLLVPGGCAQKRVGAPPPAPAMKGPTDAIPGGLDVALRLDLGKIRQVLGEGAFARIRAKTQAGGASGDASTERMLADALARADAVWLAFRPAKKAELTDSVIVLKGRFAGFEVKAYASTPAWTGPIDLGGAWRRYDRDAPKARAAPARVYARSEDVLVFVSNAEVDSVERRLEQGADDSHLEPAESGVLSLDARAPALERWLEDRAPVAARLLASAERLKLKADLESVGLRAELELSFDSEQAARLTADGAGEVAKALASGGGLFERASRGLSVEAVGSSLVMRLELPLEILAALLACLDGGSCD